MSTRYVAQIHVCIDKSCLPAEDVKHVLSILMFLLMAKVAFHNNVDLLNILPKMGNAVNASFITSKMQVEDPVNPKYV